MGRRCPIISPLLNNFTQTSCLLGGRIDAVEASAHGKCTVPECVKGVMCCMDSEPCADGGEGIPVRESFEGGQGVYACKSDPTGQDIEDAPGCGSLYRVCTGADIHLAFKVTYAEATSFDGCYAYNSNNGCNQCFTSCDAPSTANLLRDPKAPSKDQCPMERHIPGMGKGCSGQSSSASCLGDGRIDAQTQPGCDVQEHLSGVMCCPRPSACATGIGRRIGSSPDVFACDVQVGDSTISEAPGCSETHRICTGRDIYERFSVDFEDAIKLRGCYLFDSIVDCDQCLRRCGSTSSYENLIPNTSKPCEIGAECDRLYLAAVGANCPRKVPKPSDATTEISCLQNGRIDLGKGSASLTDNGCHVRGPHSGVLCCPRI
eukprot:TRINITY_DN37339_c0_g1_i1.p1 TRINITY_DN37339_c0_g1~~TRINITY_DN37339_c0_g1_i1.p1  ORF type:complete len:375 (+),score=7.83 TRINITY_DN37339_c0_g1_i1:516-1640(+)